MSIMTITSRVWFINCLSNAGVCGIYAVQRYEITTNSRHRSMDLFFHILNMSPISRDKMFLNVMCSISRILLMNTFLRRLRPCAEGRGRSYEGEWDVRWNLATEKQKRNADKIGRVRCVVRPLLLVEASRTMFWGKLEKIGGNGFSYCSLMK